MTLGRKLFLLIGGLLCLLFAGQALLYRSLARAVSDDVRTVAFRVGEEIVSGFEFKVEDGASPPPPEGQRQFVLKREVHWKSAAAGGAGAGRSIVRRVDPGGQPLALDVDEGADRLLLYGGDVARSIPIPARIVSSTLERFGSQLLVGNLVLLAAGLAAAAWFAHRMTRPLAGLAAAAERIGAGELGAAVVLPEGRRRDEVGRAVASFNRMSARLSELDRENRRLGEAEQLSELGDVARGLAHSLRNPLNALGLAIERLGARAERSAEGELAPARVAELVDGSRRQIRRIDGALRSFLALASAGGATAEEVDLAALAREVALEALHDAPAGGAPPRIEVDSSAAASLAVQGVAAELKAILQALVVNACEATAGATFYPGDGDPPRVAIRLLPRAAGASRLVAIEVEDDGAGIAEQVRGRLFTPHVTTKPHGSGMGLFLAHRLTTARYGGALTLEPRPGGGTRAVLEIGDRLSERSEP